MDLDEFDDDSTIPLGPAPSAPPMPPDWSVSGRAWLSPACDRAAGPC